MKLNGSRGRLSYCLLSAGVFLSFASAPGLAQGGPGPGPGPASSQQVPGMGATPAQILRKGTQLIDAGRLQEALNVFQEYCQNRPGDGRAYFWMGVCYDEMGNLLAATQAYHDGITKAEQNGMDSTELRMNLGNVLLKQNQADLAIEAYKRALEINPAYGLAELNLGRAYIAKGDFKSALASFDKCNELRFNARQLSYYRAKALLGLGRTDEAAVIVQRLLQDFPEGSAKADIQREFQSCLKTPQ